MTALSSERCDIRLLLKGWVLTVLGFMSITLSPWASAQNQAGKAGAADTHATWRSYGGSPDGSQYSALHQIDRSNVTKLQIAWTYRTGDDRKYAFNPLVIEGTMYVLAKNNAIVALDAATGKEIWRHPTDPNTTLITNRVLTIGRMLIGRTDG